MGKIKRTGHKVVKSVKKHSPAILLVGGIIGFAGAAYKAYKAAPKVEMIVAEMEEAKASGTELEKVEVFKALGTALAPAIGLGILSAVSVVWSYKIQYNRLLTLSSVLASTQAAHKALEHRIKNKLGQKAYEEFISTDEEHFSTEDENGDTVDNTKITQADVDSSLMEWFSNSSEAAKDGTEGAYTYNTELIRSMTERAQTMQFNNCGLMLNEFRDIFGWDRLGRMGALTGWSSWDSLNIELIPMEEYNEVTHRTEKDILVKWTAPRYIYDNVDYGIKDR